jgi:hypothetical protein
LTPDRDGRRPAAAAGGLFAAGRPARLDRTWGAIRHPGEAGDYFQAFAPPFRPEAQEFDPVNAWWLGEIAGLVYRRGSAEAPGAGARPSRARVLGTVGLEEAAAICVRGLACAVVRPREGARPYAVAVFRGVTGLRTWAYALDARPVRAPRGGVHRGFHRALGLLWPRLQPWLKSIPGPWFFTGHSMGGALALLAAARHPPQAVYTFGAPRVGDAAFMARLAPLAHHHLVTPCDPVPHLTPPTAGRAFAPLQPGLRFCRQGHLHPPAEDRTAPGQSAALDLWRLIPFRPAPPEGLSDHAPANYRARLAALLPAAPPS